MKTLILFIFVVTMFALDSEAGVRIGVRIGAPPPCRREIIVAPPYKHSVWVPGHWVFDPHVNNYLWVPGSWHRPPHRQAVWVTPSYTPSVHGHIYVGGYWR